VNLLPQTTTKKPTLTEKQETFLDTLFSNGGDVHAAAEIAGYSSGSVGWLKDRLADEIIERTRTMLSSQALKAANKIVSLVDSPDIERQDTLRMQAAEAILNRVGLGKQETLNHNVQAVHGVVLLPPKKQDIEEVIIDG
jgi:phage terminase small subunit